MTELHWTEINNVATVWADVPGPFRAGLLFRTGRVDETMTTAGHTHLIEHLTLSSINDATQPHNGLVTGAMTGFFTMGQPQGVADFLSNVCNYLTSLPGNRLENEKQILAAENATRPYDYRTNLLTRRYGTAGYGMVGLPEFGLRSATLEQLRAYSIQRFTRENAILWLSGPPPADIHLNLPHGTKQPIPPLAPVRNDFPSWFVDDGSGGIASGAIVPRVSASTIFFEIASRRLRDQLRMAQAVSYAPAVFYDHLDAQTAHLILFADSEQEQRAKLADIFGEFIEGLVKFEEAEVETARQQVTERWSGSLAPPPADKMMMELQRASMDWLFDKPFETLEYIAEKIQSVTVDDVSKFADDAKKTMVFALPSQVPIKWFGKRLPPSNAAAVQGKKITHLDAPIQREYLIHGPDGISVCWPDGTHITVRYADLTAALYYDDGCVCLVGSDATFITIEPTLWYKGQSLCKKIREKVPSNLILNQPTRPSNTLPKPRTTLGQRLWARLVQR